MTQSPKEKALHDALIRCVSITPEMPLMLSGGLDSLCVLAALMEIGSRPTCFTFYAYPNDDLRSSQRIAKALRLRHVLVPIPLGDVQLRHDVAQIIKLIGKTNKIDVQVSHPILYAARAILREGHGGAWTGLDRGDLYGLQKDNMIKRWTQGDAVWQQARVESQQEGDRDSSVSINRTALSCGVVLNHAFWDEGVVSAVLAMNYRELHRPRPKSALMRAFPDFFKSHALYRRPAAYQVESGIRLLHNSLLDGTGFKDVAAVYRRMV